ncbi:MAG: hypothetical protein PHQ12_02425 [Chthoniobacteraceae bacterium]|nr:hypothetical protein [Chthoniobacteraceae bacterium]
MKTPHRSPSGFSLVEVALAIGIAGFCLISILGLIPVGLSVSQNASAQNGAVGIMGAIAADLRNAQTTGTASPYFKFSIPDTTGKTLYMDEEGHYDLNLQNIPKARYRVEVKTIFQPSGADRSATRQKVLITWPARAAVGAALGTAESILELDRN